MKKHLRRWGAVYLILALFLGSWIGQFFAQLARFRHEAQAHGEAFEWSGFLPDFFASTFENWQSEWLQLAFQATLLMAMKHLIFRADAEDEERLEIKIDRLLEKQGIDWKALDREVHETFPTIAPRSGR